MLPKSSLPPVYNPHSTRPTVSQDKVSLPDSAAVVKPALQVSTLMATDPPLTTVSLGYTRQSCAAAGKKKAPAATVQSANSRMARRKSARYQGILRLFPFTPVLSPILTLYLMQYKTEICRVCLTISFLISCADDLISRPFGYPVHVRTESVAVSYIPNCQQTVQLRELRVFLRLMSTKRAVALIVTRTTHLFLSCSASLLSATRKSPRLQLKQHSRSRHVPELALSELIPRHSINPP